MATPPDFTAGQILTAAQMNQVGLWLIKTQTIGSAVSTVTVSDVFSADYDSYKVIVSGGTSSTFQAMALRLGATTTGYYAAYTGVGYTTAAAVLAANNNAANFTQVGIAGTNGLQLNVDIVGPNLAKNTFIDGGTGFNSAGSSGYVYAGFLNDTTQYTAFTLIVGGTITGGTITVYGYRN